MVDLINLLPRFYRGLKEMQQIQSTLQQELTAAEDYIKDILAQMSLHSATWGLRLWEKELGLETNESLSFTMRREIIRAKMRGSGTTTKKLVTEVAQSYSYGEVTVTEVNEIYTIKITFVGEKGIPANLAALKRALREIIPAHLVVQYVFTYLTWDEFDAYNKTWDEWDALNLTWDEFEKYSEIEERS